MNMVFHKVPLKAPYMHKIAVRDVCRFACRDVCVGVRCHA
jgi:hypothetical protein